MVKLRPMFKFLSDNYSGNLIGVEIGVRGGLHSKTVLESLTNINKLYLVDPYKDYICKSGRLEIVAPWKEVSRCIMTSFNFDKRIEWIYKKSDDAVVFIPNNLDFVYIDGLHIYNQVYRDIYNYYPKIKKGGIIGGHDFNRNHPGVKRAVKDFCRDNKIHFHKNNWSRDTVFHDWWIVK